MSDEPPASGLTRTARRAPWLKALLALQGLLLTVVFTGWLVQSCQEARATSRAFVLALHEGRLGDARALASPEMAPYVDGERELPDANRARTIELLRAPGDVELGIVQSGFSGTWPVFPFGCFDGALTADKKFWIMASKLSTGWRVVEVRSDTMPSACEGSE